MIVETASGRLEGRARGDVVCFAGVPYAAAPVGVRRFAAPEPVQPWAGVREAFEPAPAAPQPEAAMDLGVRAQSEDCLALNVWCPREPARGLPVLVWVHGGAFLNGSGSQPVYAGHHLARRGAVVVTLNYRLGALGFACLEGALEAPFEQATNVGLRDQLLALTWVRDNIAQFGGDPRNVTLFGESAGGMSVAALMASPAARGLFQRAICQSGAAHHTIGMEQAHKVTRTWLRHLEVSPARPAELRKRDVSALLRAQTKCLREVHNPSGGGRRPVMLALPFLPVVDGDLLPSDPLEAIAQGSAADVPLLVGSTRDEWMLFARLLESGRTSLTEQGLHKVADRRLPGRAAQVVAGYYARWQRDPPIDPLHVYAAFESDRMFRVPALRLAEAQLRHQPHTYVFEFQRAARVMQGKLGACHGVELPFVFGTLESTFGRSFAGRDETARVLAERTMDAWLAFAREGRPRAPHGQAWPAYELSQRSTLCLDVESRLVAGLRDAERALWDDHL